MSTSLRCIHRWYAYAILFALFACGNNKIDLAGVDLEAWKQDPEGCREIRAQMIIPMEEQRDELLRLNEMEIIDLLGKPDENELYVRSQQFYRYYLEPGPECKPGNGHPKVLVIRFNAVGVSSEVTIE